MGADVFVPFVFFGFLGAVILVPIWLKERTKQSAHVLRGTEKLRRLLEPSQ